MNQTSAPLMPWPKGYPVQELPEGYLLQPVQSGPPQPTDGMIVVPHDQVQPLWGRKRNVRASILAGVGILAMAALVVTKAIYRSRLRSDSSLHDNHK